jgi:hypothetical protein
MKPEYKTEALEMVELIEKQRKGASSSGIDAKKLPATATILAAEPELQAAFVECVVARFAKLGARKTKVPVSNAWFHERNVPWGAGEAAKLLLRRRLPFTVEALAEMLEQIAGMDFITAAPPVEGLFRELEKQVAEGSLSSRVCTASRRVADRLLLTHWSAADAENWGLPRAADRKLALRIERLLRDERINQSRAIRK